MANRQAFGRRVNPQTAYRPAQVPVQPAMQRTAAPPTAVAAEPPSPMPAPVDERSLDAELQAWKQTRGSRFRMPWSQLSLMASLCFAIASFVLPDSVNDSVDWLLWGLALASGYVWFSNRRKKNLKEPVAP